MVYLWVGLGGALGAMARVGLMRFLPSTVLTLPFKVLVINIVGCFLMGALVEGLLHLGHVSFNMKHLLIQGFLGGFTTFSAFALEFGLMTEKGQYALAASYVVLSVALGLGSFFFGLRLIRTLV